MNNNSVIERIRNGEDGELEKVYVKYRREFISWVIKRYQCSVEDAADVYQQIILTFYENVVQGKLVELKSNLKTYLFAIGKNKIMEGKKYGSKFLKHDDFEIEKAEVEDEDKEEKERELTSVEKSLKLIGEHCKQLLEMFYYQKKNIDEITDALGYKNSASARNQKYKCMEKLRKVHLEDLNRVYE